MRWMTWHCPPDTGLEIRALAVWGRARYLSVTEVPRNIEWLRVSEVENFVSSEHEGQSGVRTRDLRFCKQAALSTAPGPPPIQLVNRAPMRLCLFCHTDEWRTITMWAFLAVIAGLRQKWHAGQIFMPNEPTWPIGKWTVDISRQIDNHSRSPWAWRAMVSQPTWDLSPTLVYCWPTVYDVGPTVNQRRTSVSCLLRYQSNNMVAPRWTSVKRMHSGTYSSDNSFISATQPTIVICI